MNISLVLHLGVAFIPRISRFTNCFFWSIHMQME